MSTQLEQLKDAYEAATPGHWMDCGNGNVYSERDVDIFIGQVTHNPDAQFITLAHNLMPTLLEAMEVALALGDAYDMGQRAADASAIGRYRALLRKLNHENQNQ